MSASRVENVKSLRERIHSFYLRAKSVHQHFGVVACMFDIIYNCLNKLTYFKVLRGMTLTLDSIDAQFLDSDPGRKGEVISGSTVSLLTAPDIGMNQNFIDGAEERGDWSYVFREHDNVINYGWYSKCTVPIDAHFAIQYSDEYTYMYKGFTVREYRGEKLHAYGMARALNIVAKSGDNGLISYVEADNFASLRSCERLGYEIFGSCWLFRIFGRFFALKTPGCRRFEFGVEIAG